MAGPAGALGGGLAQVQRELRRRSEWVVLVLVLVAVAVAVVVVAAGGGGGGLVVFWQVRREL